MLRHISHHAKGLIWAWALGCALTAVTARAESRQASDTLHLKVTVVAVVSEPSRQQPLAGDLQIPPTTASDISIVHNAQSSWASESVQQNNQSLGLALKNGSAELETTVVVVE